MSDLDVLGLQIRIQNLARKVENQLFAHCLLK